MASYINPHTGATIGYLETSGTTVEPFNVPMMWQSSTLSYVSLLSDASGNLQVTGGGGGGGNAAAGPTGSPVPGSADYLGINVGGNLVGVSAANPLPVSISATVIVRDLDETSRIDTTSTANVIYSGSAAPGSAESAAVWKITQTNLVAGMTISVLFASGAANYTNVWANRTSLSYS